MLFNHIHLCIDLQKNLSKKYNNISSLTVLLRRAVLQ